MLTWGEGWHNNHHAHPVSARHGLKWYEIDFNWYGIWVLKKLGSGEEHVCRSEAESGEAPPRSAPRPQRRLDRGVDRFSLQPGSPNVVRAHRRARSRPCRLPREVIQSSCSLPRRLFQPSRYNNPRILCGSQAAARTIVFFMVLGVCLVALAVALNVGWIILNWREGVFLLLRRDFLHRHHCRADPEHQLSWCAKYAATSSTTVSSTPSPTN